MQGKQFKNEIKNGPVKVENEETKVGQKNRDPGNGRVDGSVMNQPGGCGNPVQWCEGDEYLHNCIANLYNSVVDSSHRYEGELPLSRPGLALMPVLPVLPCRPPLQHLSNTACSL